MSKDLIERLRACSDDTDWHVLAQDISHNWAHPEEIAVAYQAAGEALRAARTLLERQAKLLEDARAGLQYIANCYGDGHRSTEIARSTLKEIEDQAA